MIGSEDFLPIALPPSSRIVFKHHSCVREMMKIAKLQNNCQSERVNHLPPVHHRPWEAHCDLVVDEPHLG